MAMIEMNALSTVLCGSFSAKVFFPEMDKLGLGENDYDKKYPVLWLYHSDGGSSMDWLCTPAEKCAAENGIFIIAADVQHCLCTNMEYGPKYEEFMVKELPGICRNNLPLSDKPELNWIGGVGTGAYGAVKAALKHPEVFSACIAMDGIYDMGKICERAKQGETVVCHNEESLKAVFGDIDHIKGSDNDVFALAEKNSSGIGFQPPALHRARMTAHTDGRFAGKCFQIIKSQIKARKRRQKSQPRSRTPCLT